MMGRLWRHDGGDASQSRLDGRQHEPTSIDVSMPPPLVFHYIIQLVCATMTKNVFVRAPQAVPRSSDFGEIGPAGAHEAPCLRFLGESL